MRGLVVRNDSSLAQAELEKHVKHWGLDLVVLPDGEQALGNAQLLWGYLASSIAFCPWSDVYRGLDHNAVLSHGQLLRAARKACPVGDTIDKRYAQRDRRPEVHAALLRGAEFGPSAKLTTLHSDLEAVLAKYPESLGAEAVSLFHLVGTPNMTRILDDPALGLVLAERHQRALVTDLDALAAKWAKQPRTAAQTATMILDCTYPSLLRAAPIQGAVMHTSSTATQESIRSSSAPPEPAHVAMPWNMESERRFAEDPRFRRYKKQKGWPPYHDSRSAVQQYLDDVDSRVCSVVEDYRCIESHELLDMTACLARHIGGTIFTQTEQGKSFVAAVLASATPQQQRSWTIGDMAQRLLVVHHPEWQQHYSFGWNSDPTTEGALEEYLEHWPALPPGFVVSAGSKQ